MSIKENLLGILEDLRYCPICAWKLTTGFEGIVVVKSCPNHGRVFLISGTEQGYDVATNLCDE